LLIKFFIYLSPLLVLSEVLIVVTNILLKVTPFMMWLSCITLFLLTPGIVSIGIGLGAAYPDFNSENPAQTVTSFSGLVFMLLSTAFIGIILIIEAGPVYTIFMSKINGHPVSRLEWLWIAGSFCLSFILSLIAIIRPIRFGEKRLAVHLPFQPDSAERLK
jgi:ABC-2 type transport system permease protein